MTDQAAAPLHSAGRATTIAFAALGLGSATWASRIPQVKAQLQLSNATLGIVLIAIAAGSLLTLPLAGSLVNRYGADRVVRSGAVTVALAFAGAAICSTLTVVGVFAGLFAVGIGTGLWDVSMNVHGAMLEHRAGRSLLPRFHAWFSVGTVTGALLGVVMVALRVPVAVHVIAISAIVLVAVPLAVRQFLPGDPARVTHSDPRSTGPNNASDRPTKPRSAWRSRRALLVGLFVVPFAWAEGAGGDWVGVSMIEGHHSQPAIATATYGMFLVAMTAGRWQGHVLLDRYGRVGVMRTCGAVTVAGLALFILVGSIPVAFVGALLWGLGTSLGFPVGTSAAADVPELAASSVSVVSSIGYLGFLGGPPLIGLLARHGSVLHALGAVAAGVLLAAAGAGVTRKPAALDATP